MELNFGVTGSGDPVLFIHASLLPDGFLPLLTEPSLADHYRLIRYHRRGMGGSTPTDGPVTVGDQAGDAAGLLAHAGVERSHVVGHSYGGLIELQLALNAPEMVGSLALLEPNLLAVPSAAAFNDEVRPAFHAYRGGDKEKAVAHFLGVVAGLPWTSCRQVIENRVPGGVAQAIADADMFFAVEVPALRHWAFSAEHAARIECPVLSVLGKQSHLFFREGRDLLHRWFPQLEKLDVPDTGHLLQLQNPESLSRGLGSFFARHKFA